MFDDYRFLSCRSVVAQARAAVDKDKAALAQAKANREKDEALAKLAKVNAKRYDTLAQAGAISRVERDSKETESESTAAVVSADNAAIQNAEAQIAADEASLQNALAMVESAKAAKEQARVQFNWTTVNSPISGRTGRILVLQGNTVKADEEILVTINQLAPIFVEFSVPDDQFELVQKYGKNSLKATAYLKARNITREGSVTFMDNTVDNTTGTVKLKAVFDNADSALWPGKYVDVILTLTTLRDSITIPSQAVQTGQSGQFVWLLKGKKVHMQSVTTGPTVGGLTVIERGVELGDKVVTDGQLQLAEGSEVKLIEQP
ncbi:MAG: efflux RND transporter periplasmic adaptor subunit [Cyanobacteria bacterium]|nr:efflux RND transporter periplasmic adaptor subunit [Cyanobacteriota bacterium]